jgi:hypothetical protein
MAAKGRDMALAENLQAAQQVVDDMKAFGFFAANRRSDRIAAVGGVDAAVGSNLGKNDAGPVGQAVGAVRSVTIAPTGSVDAFGAPVTNTIGQLSAITLVDVTANCASIIAAHAGNCWEQAQVAFIELYNRFLAVRPLDLMYFRNVGYDHVWVGVGLAPGWNTVSPIRVGGAAMGRYNLRNWGPDAVWCDPWQSGGIAFSVADMIAGKVRNLDAIYKCNTAESVEEGWPGSYLRVP